MSTVAQGLRAGLGQNGSVLAAAIEAEGSPAPKHTAQSLAIAGLVPLSTVDWPGRLVATLFLQGCPWSCVYCHNEALIDTRTPGEVDWIDVQQLLERRKGLLDGVVFTGGEACRQGASLADAARWVKQQGFKVGLHTAGAFPMVLQRLLDEDLIDWVGLDIKALRQDYFQVVQRGGAGERAWQTLDLLVASGVDHEIRLTTFPAFPRTEAQIASQVADAGAKVFALQQARPLGTPAAFAAQLEAYGKAAWDEQFRQIAEQVKAECGERFQQLIIRADD
ncbi:anaerobic ribonucleoside-triphosphate reductase activating protein [Boudabousia marimammalium]|uniref:Anaerobic ribonucleoside-triphosphate reductase activating protein n=1 Tax=Boudabousia marimammalium TaxID=156892 RepID=A0A1Q5PM83_9ACTO|nr:anaerobic ribonucleoside-triphosphate reductase activating protein [Boudabousia marimammalium]OKL48654.1 anaerobic ribonucleoside-triphosphate reductase activating protein [Boudabousia marimammalium]